MILAAEAAYDATGRPALPRGRWSARTAGSWATTTSAWRWPTRRAARCRDGLEPDGVNRNQGAESTLMWLTALENDPRDPRARRRSAGAAPTPAEPALAMRVASRRA